MPGGLIQFGETPEEGLRRELLEETGIVEISDLRHLECYISSYRVKTHFNISAGFLFSFYSGVTLIEIDKVTLSRDLVDYAWVSRTDAVTILGNAYGPKLADYIDQSLK